MHKPLPFFNWSLKKAQKTEPDSFIRARISIVFTILLVSSIKCAFVLGFSYELGLWLQWPRAAIAMVLYLIMIKILLYKPASLKLLTHIMVLSGILIIVSNIFIYTHKINLVTIQFVFMIVLCGFYTLGSSWGISYAIMSILPVLLFLIFKGNIDIFSNNAPQELPSPGFEIIITLNFVSTIIAHFLFYQAFHVNLKEKETLNRQLQLSAAEANELARSKSDFLSKMSHELRTPLNSVIGITELLLDDNPEERQMENLKILQFSALDLLSLINNVLDFNKIESDRLVLETIPFNLQELMQNICAALRIKARDKQIDFQLDIDSQLEKTNVVSDPTRLSQLIYNLAGNAIKFTDIGSVTVKLDCVSMQAETVDVLFSVTDTGIGIQPGRHETIFELFTQAESDITRKYGGTGLGLAIVKQLLSRFNSSIQLESSPGSGSRFSFTISFATTPRLAETIVPAPAESARASDLRILIAEDNSINRLLLKKQLEKLNLQAVMVENGRQAFDAFIADHYDIIFMDLQMPELDGYETLKMIRALKDPAKAYTYTIAFTASVTEQDKILSAGFNDFLYKPVNNNDLREKLEKHLYKAV